MNERIKALYKEATGKSFANDFDARVLEAEKFAELIVRESFDAVINDGSFHDAKNIIRAAKVVAMEHFGVE